MTPDLPDGFAWFDAAFDADACEAHFAALHAGTPWEDHVFRIFGREVRMPRRIAFYGPHDYAYSGVHHPARPLTSRLEAIRARVEHLSGARFNTVLVNLYRDGSDGMGWHSDDDYPHGGRPEIASISFGAVRRFRLRERVGGASLGVDLQPGAVLLMRAGTQARWAHGVPKTRRAVGPRINLTFRYQVARPRRAR